MASFINGVTNYEEWRDHSKDNKKFTERMSIISELLPRKDNLTLGEQIMLVMIVIVSSLTGKLEDFYAISTSVLMNKICQARAKVEGCICMACYAARAAGSRSSLCQALETNFLILNNFLISEEAWRILPIPSINLAARIEAHGDVATEICAINYIRIINSHKHLTFAVFTKNIELYRNVLETCGKPDNMIFILSSPMENCPVEVPEWAKKYVDYVFTVYTKEYAKEHNIEINCGTWEGHDLDHRCKTCMRCYDKEACNTKKYGFYINELKK